MKTETETTPKMNKKKHIYLNPHEKMKTKTNMKTPTTNK